MTTLLRLLCAITVGFLALNAASAQTRTVTDSGGRQVEIPVRIQRVFAAGPPASTLLYILAPETMVGWTRKPREEDMPFLRPEVRELPEMGRLSGRGDSLSLERLLLTQPDIIIDFGTLSDTYLSLADRIQAQTGIPYLLIDGRFENTAAALRLLAQVIGVPERGELLASAVEAVFAEVDRVLGQVPPEQRPRAYLARGPDGMESGSRGSINTEIIERVGAVNVVSGLRQQGGLVNTSFEQLIAWQPDTIITLDRRFWRTVQQTPHWQVVPAVRDNRVFLAPSQPFGSIDFPPSINRVVGLKWLLHVLYPDHVTGNLRHEIRALYRLLYQVELTDADLDQLLGDDPQT